ncbi:MAG TPA: hypothetical protein VHX60_13530 [Acidobacteriaceae bacterium]|jgi:hypothetical protein|nr:hypothetical protein [Acidobacteriaceae bacterium]
MPIESGNRPTNLSAPQHRRRIAPRHIALIILATLCSPACPAQSRWAHPGPNGKLIYARTKRGDRIPDFSSCGYRGGGVALPDAPERITLTPGHLGDDAPRIQAALDKVGRLPARANGIRGAVVLAPGTYYLLSTLQMHDAGVVLRGSGPTGTQATVLQLSGAPHLAINIAGEFHQQELPGATWLTDRYVPAGATIIHVADASAIHPGDLLEILKPVTPAWVHFMRMDHLARDGEPETWVKNNSIPVRRRVVSVQGNAIQLEVPLTDSFDARFYSEQAATVTRVAITGRIAEAGVENLRITAPPQTLRYGIDPEFDGIALDDVLDAWVRSVTMDDMVTAVRIGRDAQRITAEDVDVPSQAIVTSTARAGSFWVNGTQILIDRCHVTGDKLSWVETQAQSEGPVVVLHGQFSGNGKVEPHQRWSTGFLVDSSDLGNGDLRMRNRGEMGSGHGWTIGWSVSWNNTAARFLIQNPPGVLNWSIGDIGNQETAPMPVFDAPKGAPLPAAETESSGAHVEPPSLYLQQLRERLGPVAVAAIGYR